MSLIFKNFWQFFLFYFWDWNREINVPEPEVCVKIFRVCQANFVIRLSLFTCIIPYNKLILIVISSAHFLHNYSCFPANDKKFIFEIHIKIKNINRIIYLLIINQAYIMSSSWAIAFVCCFYSNSCVHLVIKIWINWFDINANVNGECNIHIQNAAHHTNQHFIWRVNSRDGHCFSHVWIWILW